MCTEFRFIPESETCPNCGATILRSMFTEGEVRQVIDLCNDIIETTEKISMTAKCPICGTVVKGDNVNYNFVKYHEIIP